ncbi:GNAT family N-acetyltransferase [Longirhabdus pacifica]|uniref:GNAT family N-acetyltransferase n=1 Tax=Longirhabdus pacifica TaxID=2305227 RepID=UPI0010087471|nr:GNAT family N-acetyltransferase [Longirhabdus pacifica]
MQTNVYTKRLHLRKLEQNDAASLFTIWSDPDVTRFMNIDAYTTEEQVLHMIGILNKLFEENKAIRYAIIKLDTHDIIGTCGYNMFDFENEVTEIGYELGKTYWGQGFAAEAIQALLDHAFHTLSLHRVEAKIEPNNVNSIRLIEKLQFSLEGTKRQCEKINGKWIDLHLYAKLNEASPT